MLAEKYRAEIKGILAKYPPEQKRSAVLSLLYLAQKEYGYVTPAAREEVAGLLDLEPTQVGSLVGYYTLFYDRPGGKHRLQICTDLPCALRGAEQFAAGVSKKLGVKLGETTADGMFTVESVMCLAACDRAPMFQLQNRDGLFYHENQTVESAHKLTEKLRQDDSENRR